MTREGYRFGVGKLRKAVSAVKSVYFIFEDEDNIKWDIATEYAKFILLKIADMLDREILYVKGEAYPFLTLHKEVKI